MALIAKPVLRLVISVKFDRDVVCCRFSTGGESVAVGLGDGSIHVVTHLTSKANVAHVLRAESERTPVTCIRYTPKESNTLLATYASGCVRKWHVTSNKCLSTVNTERIDTEGALTALDYRCDGEMYAVGGSDFIVRVFDSKTNKQVAALGPGKLHGIDNGVAPEGHTNRVFALAFHPSDPKTLVSGGWDKTVQVWDVEKKAPLAYFYGPFLGGNGLCINKAGEVLCGSYSDKKPLEIVKLPSLTPKQSFFNDPNDSSWIYACQFGKTPGKTGNIIVSAGTKENLIRIFSAAGRVLASHVHTASLFDLDLRHDDGMLAVAAASKELLLFAIRIPDEEEELLISSANMA
eukprot:m.42285 g.42285  ORF g.42285 m.42285 type:complete len:348 (-) comp12092_c0_seq3:38-1081(-)